MFAYGHSMKFEWQQVFSSLQDSSQNSGYLNNALVWMVSTRPLISKTSSPFNSTLVTASSALITVSITITLIFHSFFLFSSKVSVLTILFAFFQFYPVISWNDKVHYWAGSLFCYWLSLGLVVWSRFGDPFVFHYYNNYYYYLLRENFSQ